MALVTNTMNKKKPSPKKNNVRDNMWMSDVNIQNIACKLQFKLFFRQFLCVR